MHGIVASLTCLSYIINFEEAVDELQEMAEPAYTVASDSDTTGEEKSSSVFPEIAIGIDIGTNQCSVAVWNGSHVELLKNSRNQKMMRSYVSFKDDIPSGGAGNQLAHEYEILSGASIFNIKRLVGRVDTDPVIHKSKRLPFLVQTLDIGVRPFIAALVNNIWRSTTPEEVMAIFLVELRAMAEAQLKRAVRNVVLTTPVCFSRFQLTRIERACAMAGLHVLRLMPEPTAVALLYAQQQQEEQTGDDSMGSANEKIALIFSMGAGFCDAAVTATAGGVSHIKALAGSPIGGEDILQNMMSYLLPNSELLFSNHGVDGIRSMGLLRVATQDAIHKLSVQNSVHIDVEMGNGYKVCKIVDRREFENVNGDVFEACESLVMRCLRDAKVGIEDLDDVIVVGGCSNIPKIKNILLGLTKKETFYEGMNPFEAPVIGAALEGAVASGISDPFGRLEVLTIQATPLDIGIKADGNNFVPIIPKNTTMPSRKDLIFTTSYDNQSEAMVVVYEGEGKTIEENHLLGYFKFVGIPSAPKGVPEINICMDIDALNMLRVLVSVILPGSQIPACPAMEVRMPTVDDGHGWCAQALAAKFGLSLDLILKPKKKPI